MLRSPLHNPNSVRRPGWSKVDLAHPYPAISCGAADRRTVLRSVRCARGVARRNDVSVLLRLAQLPASLPRGCPRQRCANSDSGCTNDASRRCCAHARRCGGQRRVARRSAALPWCRGRRARSAQRHRSSVTDDSSGVRSGSAIPVSRARHPTAPWRHATSEASSSSAQRLRLGRSGCGRRQEQRQSRRSQQLLPSPSQHAPRRRIR